MRLENKSTNQLQIDFKIATLDCQTTDGEVDSSAEKCVENLQLTLL